MNTVARLSAFTLLYFPLLVLRMRLEFTADRVAELKARMERQ